MPRRIDSQYGLSLQQAAETALKLIEGEKELLARLRMSYQYEFDFHGISFLIHPDTTADSLVTQVTEVMQARAELYERTAVPTEHYEREQSGRIGQHLDECYVTAVQCGMLWGNESFDRDGLMGFAKLRHVFEFNGIKVPFNPWKDGEADRVREVALAEMNKKPASEYTLMVCQ